MDYLFPFACGLFMVLIEVLCARILWEIRKANHILESIAFAVSFLAQDKAKKIPGCDVERFKPRF